MEVLVTIPHQADIFYAQETFERAKTDDRHGSRQDKDVSEEAKPEQQSNMGKELPMR